MGDSEIFQYYKPTNMIFGNKYIHGYLGDVAFWVRCFGYGFLFKDTSINPLMFSERYGHKAGVFIGRFFLRPLVPDSY